ncbi:MAG: DUF1844 domain-containing protein [Candidatus Omnitrophota bacterium]
MSSDTPASRLNADCLFAGRIWIKLTDVFKYEEVKMDAKRVDESWKEKAEKEKEDIQTRPKAENSDKEFPQVNFNVFLSGLGIQALIALGEIENPMTNKKEQDLAQAKYLIDTLEMIKDKTKGNLTQTEDKNLEQVLFELRTKYINICK